MEQTTKDRALMQALAPKEPRQLPSNFPYLTMRCIKEMQRVDECRQHTIAIVITIGVSLAGILTFLFLFWDTLRLSLVSLFCQSDGLDLVLPMLFCLSFFAVLNHWLSRHNKRLLLK